MTCIKIKPYAGFIHGQSLLHYLVPAFCWMVLLWAPYFTSKSKYDLTIIYILISLSSNFHWSAEEFLNECIHSVKESAEIYMTFVLLEAAYIVWKDYPQQWNLKKSQGLTHAWIFWPAVVAEVVRAYCNINDNNFYPQICSLISMWMCVPVHPVVLATGYGSADG